MRSTSERLNAVERRTRELKQARRKRLGRLTVGLSAALCLSAILAAALAMPGYMARQRGVSGYSGAAASVFASSPAAGYVLIGLLAFALGCCVTLLCICIRRRSREDPHDRDHR